jgi:hypothetical protein
MGFQCLDHPPYSPDLAPSDYHLLPGLKKSIEREVGGAKDLSAPLYGACLSMEIYAALPTFRNEGSRYAGHNLKQRLQEKEAKS